MGSSSTFSVNDILYSSILLVLYLKVEANFFLYITFLVSCGGLARHVIGYHKCCGLHVPFCYRAKSSGFTKSEMNVSTVWLSDSRDNLASCTFGVVQYMS